MRVSVVVPVHDPGPYIEDLIASLRAQSLPADEFEAVFVDDGSTDATPALLDRLAATTPNVRVIHIPASGWPGRPRNVGIDAARGDFVFLADHDDRLDPRALERLTAFAEQHGSDVVVGRIVGVNRRVPERIFRRTVVDAQQDIDLLMTSLTPQKLFRRSFLVEQGIRFPEGRRRLEDHLFVTTAYLRASRVSVYADHPVYYFVLRDDGGNASRRPVDWAAYFANAAESIEVVDREASDERTRVVMRRRWLRVEALGRVRGAKWLGRPEEQRADLLAGVRWLLKAYYPLTEIDELDVRERVVARLVLEARDDDVTAFAEWERSLASRPRVISARLAGGGRLTLRIRVTRTADAPRPALLADPPPAYPAAAELDALERVPGDARLRLGLRPLHDAVRRGAVIDEAVPGAAGSDAMPVSAEAIGSVVDGVLTATATLDLPDPLPDGAWTVETEVTGIGGRIGPLRVPAGRPGAVDIRPCPPAGRRQRRPGGRRLRLEVDRRRRLVLRVERCTLGATARVVARTLRRRARGAVRLLLRIVRPG